MAKVEQAYLLIVAPNTLIMPVPEGEAGGDVELSDAEAADIFDKDRAWPNRQVLVAPSTDIPTLATLVRIRGGAGYRAFIAGQQLVTVTKHVSRGHTRWARVVPLEQPLAKPKPSEIAALKADFIRYIQSSPKGLKIFNLERTFRRVQNSRLDQKLVSWLLFLTPLPHEERMQLAPLSLADQVKGLRAWLNAPQRQQDVKRVRALTSEDQHFLQAILKSPGDNTPRLRYADWLDEQGDPRGEFIRVQCLNAKIKTYNRRKEELLQRERELLQEYEKEWLGPLARLRCRFNFARGFPIPDNMSVQEFLKEGQRVFERCPVQHLTLVNSFDAKSKTEQLKAIAASPLLSRLTSLRFTIEGLVDRRAPEGYDATGLGIGDEGVRILAASPHLAGLQHLRLPENEIGDAGVKAIAASRRLASLVELDLFANPVGHKGAKALAVSKTLANLSRLNMRGTNIDAEDAKILRERFGNCAR